MVVCIEFYISGWWFGTSLNNIGQMGTSPHALPTHIQVIQENMCHPSQNVNPANEYIQLYIYMYIHIRIYISIYIYVYNILYI